jgi:hypothetical protein
MNEGKSFKETRIIKGRETRILLWIYMTGKPTQAHATAGVCGAAVCRVGVSSASVLINDHNGLYFPSAH